MKQKSSRRTSKKSKKTRKQRGGNPKTFQVVLFSSKEPTDDLKRQIKELLDELYGGDTTFESSTMMKYQFTGSTGLPSNFQKDDAKEIVFTVKPPGFLEKNRIYYDTRLTALEGQIADKILEKAVPISLIPPAHGLTDEGESIFIVGLMTDTHSFPMRKGMYQSAINTVMK